MAQQTIDIGAAPNDGTGDPIRDAFDKCNDNFTELYAGLVGLLDFKGATDCSANPNYPAASKGDFYLVSVAGKIGGGSGVDVELGDAFFATADNAGGTQASVGTSWTVLQGNITGSVGGIDVEDEGVSEATGATTLNFTGAGVTAADVGGGVVDITIPGGGSGIDIEDEGVAEATGATTLNFVGAGVTAADMGGGVVDVTISGGGSGVDVEDEGVAEATGATTLNFTGSGVTATDMGGGVVDVAIPGSSSFNGAMVYGSSGQSLTGGATTTLTWDSEAYDTSGWHDTGSNTSRLTVPSGVNYVIIGGRLSGPNAAGQIVLSFLKGGSASVIGLPQIDTDTSGTDHVSVSSGPLAVTAGQYFEMQGFFTATGTTDTLSCFWIYAVG